MTNAPQDITKRTIVFSVPGMDAIVSRELRYHGVDGSPQLMDVYYPGNRATDTLSPAVFFVMGYSDPGAERMLGCKIKDLGSYVSWSRLLAATGTIAIAPSTVNPAADIPKAFAYVREHAEQVGIDANRIGLWSASGNVPNALALLMSPLHAHVRSAVFYYPYTLDAMDATAVAQASRTFGFVNPTAGKTPNDLPAAVPLFVARAGQDQMPGLNHALDRFTANALSRNLPLTLVNHPLGRHGFDVFDDVPMTHELIRHTLAFLRFHLCL